MTRITARIIDQGPLTAKEAEVLRYMCEGFYTTEIAVRQFRSPRTIGKHIENIAAKLKARGSSEIVLVAVEMGLVKIQLNSNTGLRNFILVIISVVQLMGLDTSSIRRPPRTPRPLVQRVARLRAES